MPQEKEKYKMLFGTKDRDAAHQRLEIERKKYPKGCCREDPNNKKQPYQVWSGPPPIFTLPPEGTQ